MPFLPAAGSVTAMTMATPAMLPEVMNCLLPFSLHPPSTLVARVRMAAASDPASLSVRAKQPIMRPAIRSGRNRACCAGVPNVSRPETSRLFWMETMVDKAPSAAASSASASA